MAPKSVARPRIDGDRSRAILDATLDVLADVGDRLTMHAVARAARASKATLYRRWTSKSLLVVDALASQQTPHTVPNTGSLHGDLHALIDDEYGLAGERQMAIWIGVATPMSRKPR